MAENDKDLLGNQMTEQERELLDVCETLKRLVDERPVAEYRQ